MMKKILKGFLVAALLNIVLVLVIFMAIIGGGQVSNNNSSSGQSLSIMVESYRVYVESKTKDEDMQEYVNLILCVMQIESGGSGLDPMQSAEGPFNDKYPRLPNGITDPYYSIDCGIKELQSCLKRANVKNNKDYENIKVALGGYNFGNGFIEWCQKNYNGIWSLDIAQKFSNIWKEKTGWDVYGDPPYAQKVMSYYQRTGIDIEESANVAEMGAKKYKELINEAEKYLGFPYVFGGSNPSTSFDCSGFICWSFTKSAVYNLPRTTAQEIYNQSAKIKKEEAKPGDLIYFTGTYDCPDPVSHIGIYVGNNTMLHCGNPISYVKINTEYWQQHFYAFGRLPINK